MSNIKPSKDYASRVFNARFQVDESGDIVGYAAVFNKWSRDLGGFKEIIEPGAFRDVLNDDVMALFNHDPLQVLGRTKSGTVEVWQDDEGLGYRIKLPDTQLGRDLKELIARGDIDTSSFGFDLREGDSTFERNEDGNAIHTIHRVNRLWDVSPVTWPAYPDTSVTQSSYKRFMDQEGEEFQEKIEAMEGRRASRERHLALIGKGII